MAAFDGNLHDDNQDEEFDAAVARALRAEADDLLFRDLAFDDRLRAAVRERVAAEEGRRRAFRMWGSQAGRPEGVKRRRAWLLAFAGSGAAAAVLLLFVFFGRNPAGAPEAVRGVVISRAETDKAVVRRLPAPAGSRPGGAYAPKMPAREEYALRSAAEAPAPAAPSTKSEANADAGRLAAAEAASPHRYGQAPVGMDARAGGVQFIVEKVVFTDRETRVHFIIPGAAMPANFTLRLSRDGGAPEGALNVASRREGGLLLGTATFNPTPRETRVLHVEMAGFHGVVNGSRLDLDDVWPVEVLLPEAERK